MFDRRARRPRRWAALTLLLLAAAVAPPPAASAAPRSAALDVDRLAGLKARLIGPAGMSGRVAAIDAVRADPDVVWVGAATGGVWKSTNAGLTWTPVFDEQPVHAIGSIGIFQPNPEIVWVGTGEGNVRNSASVGNGVYRTLDGGRTWRHVGLEKSERVYRLFTHPSDPDVAWACALGREWGENPERGVFKTSDGGATWKKVLYVDEKTGCGELAIDPANPQKLFAGMWQFRRWPWFFDSGGPGSGLYVSHDGGETWRRLQEEDGLPAGELGRMGIAVAPSNPRVVYALIEAGKGALVRSDDGGRSWRTVNDKPNVVPRPFYFADLRVDPQRPDRVYSLDYEVRVSDDGGKTFATLPGATWEQIHGDYHALWIDPADPERMYFGNDGGVAVSRDRGQTTRFVGTLPLAQFYHVAVDDDLPYHVYGGLQDNGSWRGPSAVWRDGGIRSHEWEVVGDGDGFETLPVPGDSSQGYATAQGGYIMRWSLGSGTIKMVRPASPEGTKLRFNWNAGIATDPFDPNVVYLGSQFLHKSSDRGETWTTISPDLTTNNPEWQKQDASGGLTPDVTSAENFTTIIAIAPSAVERGVLWVGTDDGRVHVSRDGGASWTSVERNLKGVPEHTWVPHIRASKFSGGEAFVVLDNHRRSDWTPYVYATADYGRTWRSLATEDLRGYCLAIEQDPVDRDLLFLGTEFGLWTSGDGGRSWSHLARTIPTASVMDLVVHPRDHDLVIGTHGRAVWILDDVRPLRTLDAKALAEPLHFYEVGAARQHYRAPEVGGFGFGAGEFRGENRPYGAILTFSLDLPDLPLHDVERERERKEAERRERRAREAAAAPAREERPERAAKEEEKPPAKEEPAAGGPAEKKDDEEKPQVAIEVADATGAVVRAFKAPAKLGVNRAVWGLQRDAFEALPPDPEAPPQDESERTGPQVPPGVYTVTLRFRGHEAKQTVEVLPDPRSQNTPAQWQERWQAVLHAGASRDRLVDAIWRLRRTRDDVALVQDKARQRARDAGEKDEEKLARLPLVESGDAVKKGLTELEKRLWQPPDTIGIVAENDVMSKIGTYLWYLSTSWDPPNPTYLEHQRQADALLEEVLAEVEAYFAKEVAGYRKQVEEGGIGLLGAGG